MFFKIILSLIILVLIISKFYEEIKINNTKQKLTKTKVDTLKRIEKMNRSRNEDIRKNNIQKEKRRNKKTTRYDNRCIKQK